MAMKCDHVLHHLDAYVRGETDGRTGGEIGAHLSECDRCRREESAARRIAVGLRALHSPATAALVRDVLASAPSPRSSWFTPARALAACLILGFVIFFTSRGLEMTRPIPLTQEHMLRQDQLPSRNKDMEVPAPPQAGAAPTGVPDVIVPPIAEPAAEAAASRREAAPARAPGEPRGAAALSSPRDVPSGYVPVAPMDRAAAPPVADVERGATGGASTSTLRGEPLAAEPDAGAAPEASSPVAAAPAPSPAARTERVAAMEAFEERPAPPPAAPAPAAPTFIRSEGILASVGSAEPAPEPAPASRPSFRLTLPGSSSRTLVPEIYLPTAFAAPTDGRSRSNELRALRFRALPAFTDALSLRRDTAARSDSPVIKK